MLEFGRGRLDYRWQFWLLTKSTRGDERCGDDEGGVLAVMANPGGGGAAAKAQRLRGKLIKEVRDSFTVDAFVANATDWEKVCLGNLVGFPVVVVPTGFKSIEDPPKGGTRRRTTITTGIYAPPDHDHIALALAMAYQSATNHHKQRPPIDDLGPNDPVPTGGKN